MTIVFGDARDSFVLGESGHLDCAPVAREDARRRCDKLPRNPPFLCVLSHRPRARDEASSGHDTSHRAQIELFDYGFAHFELLDFSGHGHREALDEAPVTRNLEVGDLAVAIRP